MRFTLAMLFALIALLAVEVATLKNPIEAVAPILEFIVSCSALFTTWGAFCLNGRAKRFCLGYAVMFWANFIYSYFNALGPHTSASQHLLKFAYDFFGHKQVSDPDPTLAFQIGEFSADLSWFIAYWKLWSYLNVGLLGGILALNINGIGPVACERKQSEQNTSESNIS